MLWSIIIIYILILVLLTFSSYVQWSGLDVYSRPPIKSTWSEGFMNLSQWLPESNALTSKRVCDFGASDVQRGPVRSYMLLEGNLKTLPEPRVAIGPTSEQCYGVDYSKTLELSSYAQRTNNYKHRAPDSCSAPNHDLILDFYAPS